MKNTKKYFNTALALAIVLFASVQTFADLSPEQMIQVLDLRMKTADIYLEGDIKLVNTARNLGYKSLEEKALKLANARLKQYEAYGALKDTKQLLSQTEFQQELKKIQTKYFEEITNIK